MTPNYAPRHLVPVTSVTIGGIDRLLAELHNAQLDMIDRAVEASNLRQAQELIDYIRSK